MADHAHSFQSPPRRDPPVSAGDTAAGDAAASAAPEPLYSSALSHQRALALSPFSSSAGSGGVVLSAAAAGSTLATIPPPAYRASLPPRPGFRLWGLLRPQRDMGGDRRAADTEARYDQGEAHGQPRISMRTVLPSSTEGSLTLLERLRYGGLMLHPQRPLRPKHLRALVLFFLALLPCIAALFALAALLACSPAGEALLAPLCAAWIAAAGAALFGVYVGSVGPFACAMEPLSTQQQQQQQRQRSPTSVATLRTDPSDALAHRWLPARFPAGVAVLLALVCTQSLIFALLAGNEFGTLCLLRERVSVNEAPVYSALVRQLGSTPTTAPSTRPDGSPAIRTNDGSARSDSSSTRAFLSFRDGFVETRMVRALNVSDAGDHSAPLVLDGSAGTAGLAPTRLLLLAPIWSSLHDPFYARAVPAWACASIAAGSSPRAQRDASGLVRDWSSPWRFGVAVNALDPDYRVYQDLVASLLGSSGLVQMSGAPLLHWRDPSSLETEATRLGWCYVSTGALLALLLWGGGCLAHAQWYRDMLNQEKKWEEAVTKRRAGSTMQVRAAGTSTATTTATATATATAASTPPGAGHARVAAHAGQEEEQERKHEVELASVARPMSPSGSALSPQDGGGSVVVSPSLVRASALSSRASAPSTFLADRPSSASAASASAAPVQASTSWWKGVWPFGGRGRGRGSISTGAVSPGPSVAVSPFSEEEDGDGAAGAGATPRSVSVPSSSSLHRASQSQSAPPVAVAVRSESGGRAPLGLAPSSPMQQHVSLHLSPLRERERERDRERDPVAAALADQRQMISPQRGQRVALSPLSGRTRREHQLESLDALPPPPLQQQQPQDDTDISDRSEDSLVRTVSLERGEGAFGGIGGGGGGLVGLGLGLGLSNRSPRGRFGPAAAGSSSGDSSAAEGFPGSPASVHPFSSS